MVVSMPLLFYTWMCALWIGMFPLLGCSDVWPAYSAPLPAHCLHCLGNDVTSRGVAVSHTYTPRVLLMTPTVLLRRFSSRSTKIDGNETFEHWTSWVQSHVLPDLCNVFFSSANATDTCPFESCRCGDSTAILWEPLVMPDPRFVHPVDNTPSSRSRHRAPVAPRFFLDPAAFPHPLIVRHVLRRVLHRWEVLTPVSNVTTTVRLAILDSERGSGNNVSYARAVPLVGLWNVRTANAAQAPLRAISPGPLRNATAAASVGGFIVRLANCEDTTTLTVPLHPTHFSDCSELECSNSTSPTLLVSVGAHRTASARWSQFVGQETPCNEAKLRETTTPWFLGTSWQYPSAEPLPLPLSRRHTVRVSRLELEMLEIAVHVVVFERPWCEEGRPTLLTPRDTLEAHLSSLASMSLKVAFSDADSQLTVLSPHAHCSVMLTNWTHINAVPAVNHSRYEATTCTILCSVDVPSDVVLTASVVLNRTALGTVVGDVSDGLANVSWWVGDIATVTTSASESQSESQDDRRATLFFEGGGNAMFEGVPVALSCSHPSGYASGRIGLVRRTSIAEGHKRAAAFWRVIVQELDPLSDTFLPRDAAPGADTAANDDDGLETVRASLFGRLVPVAVAVLGAGSGVCFLAAALVKACHAKTNSGWRISAAALAALGFTIAVVCLFLVGVGLDASSRRFGSAVVARLYGDEESCLSFAPPLQVLVVDAFASSVPLRSENGTHGASNSFSPEDALRRLRSQAADMYRVRALGDPFGAPGITLSGVGVCGVDGRVGALQLASTVSHNPDIGTVAFTSGSCMAASSVGSPLLRSYVSRWLRSDDDDTSTWLYDERSSTTDSMDGSDVYVSLTCVQESAYLQQLLAVIAETWNSFFAYQRMFDVELLTAAETLSMSNDTPSAASLLLAPLVYWEYPLAQTSSAESADHNHSTPMSHESVTVQSGHVSAVRCYVTRPSSTTFVRDDDVVDAALFPEAEHTPSDDATAVVASTPVALLSASAVRKLTTSSSDDCRESADNVQATNESESFCGWLAAAPSYLSLDRLAFGFASSPPPSSTTASELWNCTQRGIGVSSLRYFGARKTPFNPEYASGGSTSNIAGTDLGTTFVWWQRIRPSTRSSSSSSSGLYQSGVLFSVSDALVDGAAAVPTGLCNATELSRSNPFLFPSPVSSSRWDYAVRQGLVEDPSDDAALQDGSAALSRKLGTYHPRPATAVAPLVPEDDVLSAYLFAHLTVVDRTATRGHHDITIRLGSQPAADSASGGSAAQRMAWRIFESDSSSNIASETQRHSGCIHTQRHGSQSIVDGQWHLFAAACFDESGRRQCQLFIDGETSTVRRGWRQCAAEGLSGFRSESSWNKLRQVRVRNSPTQSPLSWYAPSATIGMNGEISVGSEELGFAESEWLLPPEKSNASSSSSQGGIDVAGVRVFPFVLRRAHLKALMHQATMSGAALMLSKALGVIGIIVSATVVLYACVDVAVAVVRERRSATERRRREKRRAFEELDDAEGHSIGTMVAVGATADVQEPTGAEQNRGGQLEREARLRRALLEEESRRRLLGAQMSQPAAIAAQQATRGAATSASTATTTTTSAGASPTFAKAFAPQARFLATNVLYVGQMLSIYFTNWSWPEELTSVAGRLVSWLTISWSFSLRPLHDYVIPGLAVVLTGVVVAMLLAVLRDDARDFSSMIRGLLPLPPKAATPTPGDLPVGSAAAREEQRGEEAPSRPPKVALTSVPIAQEYALEMTRIATIQQENMRRQEDIAQSLSAAQQKDDAASDTANEVQKLRTELELAMQEQAALMQRQGALMTLASEDRKKRWQLLVLASDSDLVVSTEASLPECSGSRHAERRYSDPEAGLSQPPTSALAAVDTYFDVVVKLHSTSGGVVMLCTGTPSGDSSSDAERPNGLEVSHRQRVLSTLCRLITRCNFGVTLTESEGCEIVYEGCPSTLSLSGVHVGDGGASSPSGASRRADAGEAVVVDAYITPHDVTRSVVRGYLTLEAARGGTSCPRHDRPLCMALGLHKHKRKYHNSSALDKCAYDSLLGMVYRKKRGMPSCPGGPLHERDFFFCPECEYAVCAECYEGHVSDLTRSVVVGVLDMLKRMGITQILGFLMLLAAQLLLAPVLQTCTMLLLCHASFQCQFPGCYASPTVTFVVFASLAALTLAVLFVGFPGLLFTIALRRKREVVGAMWVLRGDGAAAASLPLAGNAALAHTKESALPAASWRSLRVLMGASLSPDLWRALLDRDASMLKSLYEPYHFRFLWFQPLAMAAKALAVLPAIIGDPDSVVQLGGAWCVELVFLIVAAIVPLYSDKWIGLMSRIAAAHQTTQVSLNLLLQTVDVSNVSLRRSLGAAMLWVFVGYLSAVGGLLLTVIIIPMAWEKLKEGRAIEASRQSATSSSRMHSYLVGSGVVAIRSSNEDASQKLFEENIGRKPKPVGDARGHRQKY